MSTKNVISTAIPVVAMLDHLNKGSALSVIQQVVTAAETANQNLDAKFTNEVHQLNQKVTDALQKAEILEDFELGQIEEAFAKFVETEGMQNIIGQMCITVNGQSVKLSSVVEAVLDAVEGGKWTFNRNAEGTELLNAVLTLTNGSVATFDLELSNESTATEAIYTATVSDFNGTGASVEFYGKFTKYPTVLVAFGVNITSVDYDLKEATNLVFDLGGLVACGGTSTTTDLNNDGVVGNAGSI
ncbi:MAG: hypothetical protein RLZZ422_1484 [Pseudomonadota bacterium]|jgi:hypothetical protein